jgi:hypothetical protein
VDRGQDCYQQGKLEYPRERDAHLEPLGEDQGQDQVAEQGDGDAQADDAFGVHSFATPLAIKTTSAKNAIVRNTKATSAIAIAPWDGQALDRP